MTIRDLQEMDRQKIKETIEKMSKAEIKEVIDSCGTIQVERSRHLHMNV